MIISKRIAASFALLALTVAVSANTASRSSDIPVDTFAQLPVMDGAKLSPDGTHLAYLRPHQGRTHLAIEDLSPGGKTVIVPPVENLDFKWVRWANDDRLVFSMIFYSKRGFTEVTETRLLAVDRDGKNATSIIRNARRVETGSRLGVEMAPPHLPFKRQFARITRRRIFGFWHKQFASTISNFLRGSTVLADRDYSTHGAANVRVFP